MGKRTNKEKMESDHYELYTESGERLVKAETLVWQEHPRPQMKRATWMSLNGKWTLDGAPILVPFPPQAKLSGYEKEVGEVLTYEKRFWLTEALKDRRVLLHFDAVDQVAEVFLNGRRIGMHEGGYLSFSFDVTESIRRDAENVLQVKSVDTLSLDYPYGKQCKKRGGMWYTPVSGIWKNVWLEGVPENYVHSLKLTPDLQGITIEVAGADSGFTVEVQLGEGARICRSFEGCSGRLDLAKAAEKEGMMHQPKFWTPESPHLYKMTVTAGEDQVESYFALRTVEIRKVDGISRVCLNGEPIFLHGVLDQGYVPDGIYLPAEEAEYDRDIVRMKELGFNLLRKHCKVEPDYFYYACDKLGMLVMQDMVNSGPYHFLRDTALPTIGFKKKKDRTGFSGKRKEFFKTHVADTIKEIYNHPSVVAYTIFNEGWGQFESDAMYDFVKTLDPTRLADATSGWFAQEKNDFDSEHIYFRNKKMHPKERPMFLSECGGYALKVDGHFYNKSKDYGYGSCADSRELTDKILQMYEVMVLPAVPKGMCGCVYTQLSDVEDEINGIYTYDRKVCKAEKERMLTLAEKLQKAVK